MTSCLSLFPLHRSSLTTSSCVHPGGQRVPAQQRAARCGCMCLTTWHQTLTCGPAWLSATSTPATAPSCPFSLTPPRWPTSPCRRQRSCCPIGCCATGAPSPTGATLPRGPSRRLSAGSSACQFGRAILTTAAGWSWTWRCVRMHKWEPGTMCVTFGTNWASISEGTGWVGRCWVVLHRSRINACCSLCSGVCKFIRKFFRNRYQAAIISINSQLLEIKCCFYYLSPETYTLKGKSQSVLQLLQLSAFCHHLLVTSIWHYTMNIQRRWYKQENYQNNSC